ALPERVQAGNGLMYSLRCYARDADGSPRSAHIFSGGGRGAGFGHDGVTRNCFPSSAGNVPIEIFESRVPFLVEENVLETDSGGPGRWRGSLGKRMTLRRSPDHSLPVSIFVVPDRIRYPAPGIFGGQPSKRNRLLLNGQDLAPDGRFTHGEIVLRSDDDRFTTHVPGGAGYGPPEERDPAAVERDIAFGYVSPPEQQR
ncbi:MAG: methylhydantoinase, partial [Chloroflexi bacterium]